MTNPKPIVIDVPGRVVEHAVGGGLEGAERTNRETFNWNPSIISPDRQIGPAKDMADARSRDSVQNDGYGMGVIHTHRDSIIGAQYRLNLQPAWELLQSMGIKGATEEWAEEYQAVTEGRFNLLSDSQECWFDASGVNTLTGLLRLAVGGFVMTGEVLGTAEWLRSAGRPFGTAIQMVSPSRLCNPDGIDDDKYLRRGVKKDFNGKPIGYWFRLNHPGDFYFNNDDELRWKFVPATKPWGRRQVIHIVEQFQPDQTRGVADMVAVLKQMRMTRKFQEIVLQNAVVNATYAAAIESELPKEMVFGALGAGQKSFAESLGDYMSALEKYVGGSKNIAIDGVKMPHLFPGTKLSLKPMGTPGGVGTEFEESLLRHTAAALGLSYEQFSRDYTKTNYSSARASMGETWKFMQGRKKMVADRFASAIFTLWLEEEINAGNIPLPKGTGPEIFYDPVIREALICCDWIGASRGQIDELKETQAAVMRINSGLSTYEKEAARLGEDFRRLFRQRARENKMMEKLGLTFATQATTPGANDAQQTMSEEKPAKSKSGDAKAQAFEDDEL